MKKETTILVNDRYLIYLSSGVIYDTKEGKDIPQYVFKIRDKLSQK